MYHYTINGTVICDDDSLETLMKMYAIKRGYNVIWSQFDPDSDPYTKWCEFSVETEDSFNSITRFAKIFKKYFIGSIQITQT